MRKIKNKWLIVILALCFLFSIGYSFYFKIKPQVDARAYDVIAQNIVNGNGYRENMSVDVSHDYGLVRVGPLYEYFLAGIYEVFGHNYPAVWVLQAILHTVSAYLIYLICLLLFANSENKKKIALWGAAIFGFYPDLIEISAMLMTETLYLFFTCLLVYLFFLYIKNKDIKTFLSMAIVAGLAILVRPPLLFFLPVIFFYLYTKKEWKRILIMIIALILVFLPWTMHNYKIFGKIMPFTAAGSLNFWIGNHVGANGEQEAGAEISNFIGKSTAVEIQNESISQFKNFVLNYPGEFSKLTLLRANKYFSILRPMGFWFYTSGWRQLLFVLSSGVFSFVILILGLAGAIYSVKFKEKSLYYILAFTIMTPLILFITVVETRYRFQIYPFLAIFAAYFINSFKQNKKIWFGILLIASVIILLNGAFDGLINFEQFKDKIINKL